MKVLITGAGGFVGQRVVTRLLASGMQVRALVRNPQSIFLAHENLEWILGDIRDHNIMSACINDADAIVHLAAAKSDEPESFSINVEGTNVLIGAAHKCGVKKIVMMSTVSTKFPRRGVYAETKKAADEVLQASGLPAVILRSSVVYGSVNEGIVGTVLRYSRLPLIPVVGPGTPAVCPIHVDDVATAIEKVLSHPMQGCTTYDLGGPDCVSLDELTRTLAREVRGRHNPVLVHIPVWVAFLLARISTALGKPILTVSNVLGTYQHAAVETAEFFATYDFHPRTLAQGIKDMLQQAQRRSGEEYKIMRYVWGTDPSDYYVGLYRHASAQCDTIQQKLFIATALFECSPASAGLLAPQNRRQIFFTFVRAGMRSLFFKYHG